MHDATDPRSPHSIIPEAITPPILVGYNGSTPSRTRWPMPQAWPAAWPGP
jgi:hypothetical protein